MESGLASGGLTVCQTSWLCDCFQIHPGSSCLNGMADDTYTDMASLDQTAGYQLPPR